MAERDEKTEAPTSKRRSDARSEGNVARSTEINSVIVLLAALLLLRAFIPYIYEEIKRLFTDMYSYIGNPECNQACAQDLFLAMVVSAGKMILPIALGILAAGVAANILQVGWLFTLKPLMPKLSKINPLTGMQRLFSMRSFVDAIKNIIKIGIIGLVAYLTIAGEFDNILLLNNASIGGILMFFLEVSFKIMFRIILVLIILAILDFAYQKYENTKQLKMTKQEVKDERKQMEGDPKVKSRIRRLQIEMARRRMMKEVPRATVVVTNPTFIAIAIRYEQSEMETPIVLAKGKRLVAERIKQIAQESGVPIVEDKPLARAMYDRVAIGEAIPMDFFTAVAEILAYVYRLKNRMAA